MPLCTCSLFFSLPSRPPWIPWLLQSQSGPSKTTDLAASLLSVEMCVSGNEFWWLTAQKPSSCGCWRTTLCQAGAALTSHHLPQPQPMTDRQGDLCFKGEPPLWCSLCSRASRLDQRLYSQGSFSPLTSSTSLTPLSPESTPPINNFSKNPCLRLCFCLGKRFNLRHHFLKSPLQVQINNELLKGTALIWIVSP